MSLPRLLVLTDRKACEQRGSSLPATVASILHAGAPAIVFREKDLSFDDRHRVGEPLARMTIEAGATWIVASDLALASHLDADLLHLAASDPLVSVPFGRSCHDGNEMRLAREQGAAYVTISPIFPTRSKPGYGPQVGLEELESLTATTDIAIFALGGVEPRHVQSCRSAGVHGVAVMGSVMGAKDPVAAICAYLMELS